MDGSNNLCQLSTGHEDDWKILYETAFPQDERMPVEDLRKLISNGTVLLHKTTNKSGELLCFSVVNLMSNFSLLAYIATDSTKRSTGVGSKHMKRLIEIIKADHSSHIGLFLEIESTKEPGLDAETQKARNRRLAFYQRLGCKRLHKEYLMPSYTAGAPPRHGELMWSEFQESCITESTFPKIIEEIFTKSYGLSATDPLVTKIASQFQDTDKSCSGVDETPAITTTPAASSPQPAAEASQPAVSEPAVVATPSVESKPAAEAPQPAVSEPAVVATPSAESKPAAEAPQPAVSEPAVVNTPSVESKPAAEAPQPAVSEPAVVATPSVESKPAVQPAASQPAKTASKKPESSPAKTSPESKSSTATEPGSPPALPESSGTGGSTEPTQK